MYPSTSSGTIKSALILFKIYQRNLISNITIATRFSERLSRLGAWKVRGLGAERSEDLSLIEKCCFAPTGQMVTFVS